MLPIDHRHRPASAPLRALLVALACSVFLPGCTLDFQHYEPLPDDHAQMEYDVVVDQPDATDDITDGFDFDIVLPDIPGFDDTGTCGGNGQPCCVGAFCNAGFQCGTTSGVCTSCGGLGQACCGSTCSEGGCVGGLCLRCGDDGQPCCTLADGGANCLPQYRCGDPGGAMNRCEACGSPGQLCCATGTECLGSAHCQDIGVGYRICLISTPQASGGPCSEPTAPCSDGRSVCDVSGVCLVCGLYGEPCCGTMCFGTGYSCVPPSQYCE